MVYRYLGKTGIQVSVLAFGNMMSDKATPAIEEECFKCITT